MAARSSTRSSTRVLPAGGHTGRRPKCPYDLAAAGAAWWRWAWRLPQASGWTAGDLYVVARRARLEDDLAALGFGDDVELRDLLAGVDDPEAARQVEWALSTLKRLAGGKLAIEKEMRELDDTLGLTPEALAKLRWSIGGPADERDDLDDICARRLARLGGAVS